MRRPAAHRLPHLGAGGVLLGAHVHHHRHGGAGREQGGDGGGDGFCSGQNDFLTWWWQRRPVSRFKPSRRVDAPDHPFQRLAHCLALVSSFALIEATPHIPAASVATRTLQGSIGRIGKRPVICSGRAGERAGGASNDGQQVSSGLVACWSRGLFERRRDSRCQPVFFIASPRGRPSRSGVDLLPDQILRASRSP